jgi:hypothetical protein
MTYRDYSASSIGGSRCAVNSSDRARFSTPRRKKPAVVLRKPLAHGVKEISVFGPQLFLVAKFAFGHFANRYGKINWMLS